MGFGDYPFAHMLLPSLSTLQPPALEIGVLAATRGNRTLAARILGMDRKTLYRKLDKSASDAKP